MEVNGVGTLVLEKGGSDAVVPDECLFGVMYNLNSF